MPERTCSAIRAEVKKPSANTTSTKPGTPFMAGISVGSTWYHKKICTSSGMLRNSSTHALPRRTTIGLLGRVRKVPITAPRISASNSASTETETVQPQADSIQSRYVMSPPLPKQPCTTCCSMVSWQNTCQSQFIGSPLQCLDMALGTALRQPNKKAPSNPLFEGAAVVQDLLLGVVFHGLVVGVSPCFLGSF